MDDVKLTREISYLGTDMDSVWMAANLTDEEAKIVMDGLIALRNSGAIYSPSVELMKPLDFDETCRQLCERTYQWLVPADRGKSCNELGVTQPCPFCDTLRKKSA